MNSVSEPRPHASEISYRPDIDALRAIAVLSVVFCHVDLTTPGGYVGVDVFFVISGYLITSLILRRIDCGDFSLIEFWERRVRRIVPALVSVVVATSVAAIFILLPEELTTFGESLVALAFSVSNFHFWRNAGYFDAAAEEKLLIHTWSLAVEEQFYLVLPVFLFVMSRVKQLRLGFAMLAVGAMISFLLSVYGAYNYPSGTFFLLPTRGWELLIGSLLARFPMRMTSPNGRGFREIGSILGLALIAVPCLIYSRTTPFPGLTALAPVLGAALVIWSGSDPERLPHALRLLACRPVLFIGLISYSLYLWHWPLLAFVRYLTIQPLSLSQKWLVVLASIGLATLTWQFVETPFRSRNLIRTRAAALGLGGVSLCSMGAIGLIFICANGIPSRWADEAQIFVSTGRMDSRYTRELDGGSIPEHLIHLGAADRPAELLIWGDSHAMAILPAFESLCWKNETAACAAVRSSTPPAIGWYHKSQLRHRAQVLEFNARVADYVRSSRIPAVLLVGRWEIYADHGDEALEEALLRTVDDLIASGTRVYFMKDVPSFPFNVPNTLARHYGNVTNRKALGIDDHAYSIRMPVQDSLMPRLSSRGVTTLDPIPYLVDRSGPDESIMPGDSHGSFYSDRHHLSAYGAMVLMPLFEPIVQAAKSRAGFDSVARDNLKLRSISHHALKEKETKSQ